MKKTWFEYIVASSPAVIYVCKVSGNYPAIFVSENIVSQLGHTSEDFLSKPDFWLNNVHQEDRERILEEFNVLFEKGHHTLEYRFMHKNGQYRWMSDKLNLIRDKSNTPIEIVGSWIDITERKQAEDTLQENTKRLAKINKTLLKFKDDHDTNITNLTILTGQILNGTCALYNRLDRGMLCSTGQWNTPPNYNDVDKAGGHICFDVIKKGGNHPLIIRNLQKTSYLKTDTNVAQYKLQTYIGQAVKCKNDYVGSLCVVYQKDIIHSKEDKEILGIVASAIGIEEERKLNKRNLVQQAKIIDQIHDSVVSTSLDGYVTSWNKGAERLFGFAAKFMIGRHITYVYPEEEHEFLQKHVILPLTEKGKHSTEVRMRRKSGKDFFAHLSLSMLYDDKNNASGMIGYSIDITENKRAEIAREQFSKKLVESQEEERKRIASEIHDGLGQKIVIINNGIIKCLNSLSGKSKFKDTLNQISLLSQQSIDEIREILSNLHPHQIYQLGLKGAIESVIRQAKKSSDIIFTSNIKSIDGLYPKDVEIHYYRIFQEGLNNIIKHSDATKSSIYLGRTKKLIKIRITDNGKGFIANSGNLDKNGLGLAGISERSKILGGSFEIDSSPGAGTTISIKIPLNMEGDN